MTGGKYPERRKNPEWQAARTTDGACSSRKSWTGTYAGSGIYWSKGAADENHTRESMGLGLQLSYPSSMLYESRRLGTSNP